MAGLGTVSESVLPGGPPAGSSRWRWWHVVPLVLGLLAAVGAALITIPYYAIAPGGAIDTTPLVTVEDGPRYPPDGAVFLTTVSLRPVTLFQALQGWLDPSVDVVEREVIVPPDLGDDDLRDFNLGLMADSKQVALGVAYETLGFDAIRGRGAQVLQVVAGSPADGRVAAGDTIVAIDGDEVTVDYEAVQMLGGSAPGERVTLRLAPPEGEERDVELELGANPEDRSRGFLGVTLQTRDLSFDFPYDVDIDSERIGGPSAGLAFTLAVLDAVTDGELTGGRRVAVTGTIQLDGSVGQVGGVPQKTAAVASSDIDLFLVPRAELEQATRVAGDDVQVEGVDDLEDALRILAEVTGGNGLALAEDGGETA